MCTVHTKYIYELATRSINVTRTHTRSHSHTLHGHEAVSSGAFNDRSRTASACGNFRFVFSGPLFPTADFDRWGGGGWKTYK